jgi:hypothetical protein
VAPYGLMAEFEEPMELLHAAERAYSSGYRKLDAYSPMPIHGLAEAIGFTRTGVSPIVLVAGILGCISGFSLCWWMAAVAYPHVVAGRPFNSWPMWIPITFELTVLFASIACLLSMLGLNRLPQPYHPVFNVPAFARASTDRFFLCIEAADPVFDAEGTWKFLESLHPTSVAVVEP